MDTMRFIHMSDLHYRINYAENGFESLIAAKQHPKDNICNCISNEVHKGLDFLLITGDLTHEGEEADYQALRTLLKSQLGDIPYIVIPGNHDRRDAFCCGFLEIEPQDTSVIVHNINGLRIIGIDTGRTVNGIITKEQIRRLQDILSKPSSRGSILAIHHPLIENQDGLARAEYNKELIAVITGSDILGIFCGHTHHNFISQFASKPYFTADSIAFSMTLENDILYFEDNAAYTIMQLHNGVLSAQVKQVVPAPAIITSFSSDKLSQLFNE